MSDDLTKLLHRAKPRIEYQPFVENVKTRPLIKGSSVAFTALWTNVVILTSLLFYTIWQKASRTNLFQINCNLSYCLMYYSRNIHIFYHQFTFTKLTFFSKWPLKIVVSFLHRKDQLMYNAIFCDIWNNEMSKTYVGALLVFQNSYIWIK